MNKLEEQFIEQQKLICKKYNAVFTEAPFDKMIGLALSTFDNFTMPVNGLRHPIQGPTSTSWFIWAGEYSERHDFFQSVHVRHLLEICPKALNFLGLSSGWRFLFDNTYEDVWYDENILRI